MTVTDRVTDLARRAGQVAADLDRYLEALPEAHWTRPSDCAGWSVAGVVAHLIMVERLLGGSIGRGLRGDPGPPAEAADGVGPWRAARATEQERLCGLPPPALLADFRASLATMREAVARVATPEGEQARGWHPSGVFPLAWFPGQWLVELSLHDWDLRVAFDPDAEIHPAAVPALGPEMRARMQRCYRAEGAAVPNGVVRIDLQPRQGAEGACAWLARVQAGALELLDDGAVTAEAAIVTDPGAYALVQTGRRPATRFQEQGHWRIEGDTALAEALVAALHGY